jgi:hypothetical protein
LFFVNCHNFRFWLPTLTYPLTHLSHPSKKRVLYGTGRCLSILTISFGSSTATFEVLLLVNLGVLHGCRYFALDCELSIELTGEFFHTKGIGSNTVQHFEVLLEVHYMHQIINNKVLSKTMMQPDEEMAPLTTIPSPSSTTTTNGRNNRFCFRWKGIMYCAILVGIAVGMCLFIDSEAIIGLRDQSSSYIRKKVNQVWSSPASSSLSSTSTPTPAPSSVSISVTVSESAHGDDDNSKNITSSDASATTIHQTVIETKSPSSTINHDYNDDDDDDGYDSDDHDDDKSEQKAQKNSDTADDKNTQLDNSNNEETEKHNGVNEEHSVNADVETPKQSTENEHTQTAAATTSETASSVVVQPAPSILDKRPNLVLHIGPQKTASTTLQDAWNRPQGLLGALREDNYRYEFINPHQGWFNCDVRGGGFHDCVATKKLVDTLTAAAHNNKNLLLSDENLDSVYSSTLRDVIDDEQFKATVVVVYRRIHEWLVSWVRSVYDSSCV